MRKRILAFLLAAVLCAVPAFLLVSCDEKDGSGDPGTPTDPTSAGEYSGDISGDVEFAGGYAFRLDNGIESRLGAVADEFIAALGTPSDVMEAPSCVRDGTDRVYEYAGRLTVSTEPDAAGRDRLTQIVFQTDAIALESDTGLLLMIGSDIADADAFFGEPCTVDAGLREYIPEGGFARVTEADGVVTGIVLAFPRG